MMDLTGKRIIITGASGFIGHAIARKLAPIDCHVTRLTRHQTSFTEFLSQATYHDVVAEYSCETTWSELIQKADVVFHLAAQTSSYIADRDPVADIQVNLVPMIRIIEAARKHRPQAIVIFAGAATQVGFTQKWPVDESWPDRPITCYDLHKLACEKYLESYVTQGFVRGATLRLCNVYGPGVRPGSKDRGILNLMIRKAMAGQPLTVYGTGEQMRDYIHIDDVARAFLMAAEHIDQTSGRHFVLGSGTGHTIAQAIGLVAQQVQRHGISSSSVIHVEPPGDISPIEARHFVADHQRFTAATGWKPAIDLQAGIDETIRFYRHEAGDP